jgi:hypothetical protein
MNENLKNVLKEYLIAKSSGQLDESRFVLVTRDTKLKGLLPDSVDPSNIEAVFNNIVGEYNKLLQVPTAPIEAPIAPPTGPIEAPVAPPTGPVEPVENNPANNKTPSQLIADVRRNVMNRDTLTMPPLSETTGQAVSQEGVGVGTVGASVAQTGTSAAKAMGTPAKKMSLTLTNPEVPSGATKKGILNETGYANIVLMSIIVIIIVAIICVFIFL